MNDLNKLITKKRSWIKGHFVSGVFYGMCFGIGSGFWFAMIISKSSWFLIPFLICWIPVALKIYCPIEDYEFNKNYGKSK
jgi:hypothetical protein